MVLLASDVENLSAEAKKLDLRTMKAITQDEYGSPDVLKVEEVGVPKLSDKGVLMKIQASSVNGGDWHLMRGTPTFYTINVRYSFKAND